MRGLSNPTLKYLLLVSESNVPPHTLVFVMQESVVVVTLLFYMFTLNKSLEGWRMHVKG